MHWRGLHGSSGKTLARRGGMHTVPTDSRTPTSADLEAHAILEVVLAGALLDAGEEGPHHDARSTHGEGLDGAARVRNASVSDDRHAVGPRELRRVVDGRQLGAAAGFDLLRSGDGSSAHAHAEPVYPSVEQILGLGVRGDIPAHDLDAVLGVARARGRHGNGGMVSASGAGKLIQAQLQQLAVARCFCP